MKMQSYYVLSKAENAKAVAEKIGREYKLKADQIMPAYQPEREAIVFITYEAGTVDAKILNFCKTLNSSKTKRVALICVGAAEKGADELKKYLGVTDVEVLPEVHMVSVKSGLFSKGKVTEEQLNETVKWVNAIIEKIEA